MNYPEIFELWEVVFISILYNNSSSKLLGKFVDFGCFRLPLAIIFPKIFQKIYTKFNNYSLYLYYSINN